MSLKITAGRFKGTKIASPKEIARPTSSMMRQALFNIISSNIENSCFLDLFAGSGIIGFEALSRNADKVVFVEKNKKNAASIQKGLIDLNTQDKAKVIGKDIISAIKQIDSKFNIVFMDPPYSESHQLIEKTLKALDSEGVLENKADIFIETDYRFSIESINLVNFNFIKSKKYGNSSLHQYSYCEK